MVRGMGKGERAREEDNKELWVESGVCVCVCVSDHWMKMSPVLVGTSLLSGTTHTHISLLIVSDADVA